MNKLTRLSLWAFVSLLLLSCSKNDTLWDIANEEGVASATSWGVDPLLEYVKLDYLLSLIEENRVHSATAGRGVMLRIKHWQNNMELSIAPVDGVGKKRRVYETIHVFPGTYTITSDKGAASLTLTLNQDSTLNYFALAKKLQADSNKGLGRLTLTITPEDAQVVIYGTPQKYHDGVKLPEGQFKIKVYKAGYEDFLSTVVINDNALTTKTISLKKKPSLPHSDNKGGEDNVETIPVTGAPQPASDTDEKVITGQLEVLPQRDDVTYLITSASGEQFPFSPTRQLPVGDYSVTAKRSDNGEVLSTKQVTISENEPQSVEFDIPEPPYQYELDTLLSFKTQFLYRQRAVIHLTPKTGDIITFQERIGRHGLEIETPLLNGEYEAELHAKGVKYELGTITISKAKSNKFEFVLK
ncbi:hypothetical protein [Alteromonas sp. 14N.309.X.WAT.G.H12]|uniref:hypothetical protein n=1 Tax=Alteromonas sp. 14N.309.X.WAT.G.H12 TaxID=3120824 RepID=UPI002FCFDA3B